MRQVVLNVDAIDYFNGTIDVQGMVPEEFDAVGSEVTITIGKLEDRKQKEFMLAAEQSIVGFNWVQALLYAKLCKEESDEFAKAAERMVKQQGAIDALELTEAIDGAADMIVVAKGFLLSLGIDPVDVMTEVWRSNLSKVVNGKLLKRGDGKVLKPVGWTPPNFAQFNPLLREIASAAPSSTDE